MYSSKKCLRIQYILFCDFTPHSILPQVQMKRSKAPSVLFASKVPRLDKDKDTPVNHLALYAPKKEVEEKEKENEEPIEETKGPMKRGKNVRMTASSTPLYFLAYYKSKKKFDDTKQGHGMYSIIF